MAVSEKEAFARGAAAARAGKSVFANPYMKARGADWTRGYHSVKESERGTVPAAETGPPVTTNHGNARRAMASNPHVRKYFGSEGRVIMPHDWKGGLG